MLYLTDFLQSSALWLKPYLYQVAVGLLATLLVVYGDNINTWVKRKTKHLHFLLRTFVFILLCAFGYGALTVALTPLVAKGLANIPNLFLLPALVSAFFVLGTIAERKRHI